MKEKDIRGKKLKLITLPFKLILRNRVDMFETQTRVPANPVTQNLQKGIKTSYKNRRGVGVGGVYAFNPRTRRQGQEDLCEF